MTLETALGAAYKSCVLDNQRAQAAVDLRAALDGDPEARTAADAFLAEWDKPNDGRVQSALNRCFITKTRLDLLKAALAQP